MYEEPKKPFIEELQALEPVIKKRIMVIASGAIMLGVVYVWLGYFSNVITTGSANALLTDATSTATSTMPIAAVSAPLVPAPASAPGPGFFARISGGGEYLMAQIGSVFSEMGKALGSPRQYIVKP